MAQRAIVIANHKTKTAKLNFIDEEKNLVAVDYKNEPLTNMNFPYQNIEAYDFLFESLGKIDENTEKFYFKIL
ncbi:hypothetical protein DS884_11195 [Tenacibaculum sp. E3R01]|uniref:hypothetical protein n=1 Tax=Tenacibaculum sp. E3R01 TaxID=2267227 RepID=UPI000DE8B2AF|nr:hypothetical protein [Tenacibaculum sp. E3R01]RBW57144.1 hypothetical protein DS884_11195 [Tenacibaculum sp. E3R01]